MESLAYCSNPLEIIFCKIDFSIVTVDDNCQYWKNLDEMTLSSPNYPKWYKPDDMGGCEWLISAQEGFIIALEFNHFDVSNLSYL